MVKKMRLELDLRYIVGQSDPATGYFEEGVSDPEFLNELAVWVDEEEEFDFEADRFKKPGKMQVSFAGSRRSFFELGRYFIAMSKFSAENSKYHGHLDGLMEVERLPWR